ncbi:5-formyltetrahydrofolate cyclo-ligase [Albidovulum inexpectatum]|uniref:5-formyltetrahydrofolate cyclo-ligase n=1 Tax=Albidovulum inexpectatum TaxID=196587 RepID=A0A2S5JG28_9RHOB|nr:5-formyltetrahydrofolate cyclo-ligase [Albidovulum inexpectatum]PPB80255.1 5-formyltetrahydrofolate cyclo-ligase [Albidovulum inexpectatum]
MSDLASIKAEARAAAFARRRQAHGRHGPKDAALLIELLADHAGEALAGYMPMRTEIDCLPAMRVHEGPVGVPVIESPGTPLRFRRWTPDAVMVPGAFGALIPESGEWIEPRVLIVPLVAFDRRGYRLGYGGGFYDRTLARLRARGPVTAIGFAFSAQEMPEVPIEPTDEPLDLIVTEREIIRPKG